jgi:hypothetical protein
MTISIFGQKICAMKKSEKSTAADKVYRLRKKAAIQQANGTV